MMVIMIMIIIILIINTIIIIMTTIQCSPWDRMELFLFACLDPGPSLALGRHDRDP